jgi:hypothetical protein
LSTSAQTDPRHLQAVKAARTRYLGREHPDTLTASRDLAAAKLAEYARRVVAEAPPLTDAQRDDIAAILRRRSS